MSHRFRFVAVLTAVGLGIVAFGWRQTAWRDSRSASAPAPVPTNAPPPALAVSTPPVPGDPLSSGSGRKVFLDPVTGRPGPPPPTLPPPVPPVPDVASPLSTSGEGLVETPGTSPAGGVIIDVQGRFRSQMTVTIRPDGTVVVRCGPGDAPCARADCPEHVAPSAPVPPK